MRAITYFAVKTLLVAGENREPGDLVPEAHEWPALSLYINEGKLSPVLVATLPKAARDALAAWEEAQIQVSLLVNSVTGDEADAELTEEELFDKELAEEAALAEDKKEEVDA